MSKLLITVGSWEERFKLGYERIIQKHEISDVLLFSFKEYEDWNKNNLDSVKKIKDYNHILLSFDNPKESWFKVAQAIDNYNNQDFVFDITTSPRNVIWTVLNHIEDKADNIQCIYSHPEKHGEWLSRNPKEPRIVYKLGGELELGWPTKLLIIPGYDAERVKQLIETFEPKETILVCHNDDHNNKECMVTKDKVKNYEPDVREFRYNIYCEDLGLKEIMSETKSLFKNSNVMMASLGTKVTSIPLYIMHKKYKNSSLVYTPSNEFNKHYSHGIGKSITINLKEMLKNKI